MVMRADRVRARAAQRKARGRATIVRSCVGSAPSSIIFSRTSEPETGEAVVAIRMIDCERAVEYLREMVAMGVRRPPPWRLAPGDGSWAARR